MTNDPRTWIWDQAEESPSFADAEMLVCIDDKPVLAVYEDDWAHTKMITLDLPAGQHTISITSAR